MKNNEELLEWLNDLPIGTSLLINYKNTDHIYRGTYESSSSNNGRHSLYVRCNIIRDLGFTECSDFVVLMFDDIIQIREPFVSTENPFSLEKGREGR